MSICHSAYLCISPVTYSPSYHTDSLSLFLTFISPVSLPPPLLTLTLTPCPLVTCPCASQLPVQYDTHNIIILFTHPHPSKHPRINHPLQRPFPSEHLASIIAYLLPTIRLRGPRPKATAPDTSHLHFPSCSALSARQTRAGARLSWVMALKSWIRIRQLGFVKKCVESVTEACQVREMRGYGVLRKYRSNSAALGIK